MPLLSILVALGAACGDDGLFGLDAGESGRDAATRSEDASARPDAGLSDVDAGETEPGETDEDGLDATGRSAPGANLTACYAPPYPEADLDCDLEGCAPIAACCVGDGDCCAEIPGARDDVSFAGCAGGSAPVDDCLGGGRAFGDPMPWVDASGLLHPGGGMLADSGYVLDAEHDLASDRIEVTAVFLPATGCGASCLESAGVGLTTQAELGDGDHVSPAAGMILSGSRGQVGLIVDGDVVDWLDVTVPGGQTFTLTARPTGELTVRTAQADGTIEERAASFVARGVARVVAYGRSRNPDALGSRLGARIAALQVVGALCDVPDAWRTRATLPVTRVGSTLAADAAGPSVATDAAGDTWVAFDHQGAIHVARLVGDALELQHELGDPAFEAGGDHDVAGMRDPDLVFTGSGWSVFYTAVAPDGRRSIGHAAGASLDALFADPAPLSLPLDGEVDVDQPSALEHEGVLVLVVRVEREGGHFFEAFRQDAAGADFRRFVGNLRRLTDDVQSGDLGATEVAAPSLVIHHDAWILHYAARRGARWSIQLLVSQDMRVFRSMGTVLEGSGAAGAFDRLGVSHPDALSVGDEVQLLYAGHDGIGRRLGRVRRAASSTAGAP